MWDPNDRSFRIASTLVGPAKHHSVMQDRAEAASAHFAGMTPQGRFITDRSSVVTVVNDLSDTTLLLKGYGVELGTCEKEPEATVQPGGSSMIRVKDKAGLLGSKAWVRYTIGRDGAEVLITFECPSVSNNRVVAVPVEHATVGAFDPRGPLRAEIRVH